MTLDYEEFKNAIMNEIEVRRKEANELYKTMDEVDEYGYNTTFLANTEEESIKSALGYGRELGRLEGEMDALRWFLNVLYMQNNRNKK